MEAILTPKLITFAYIDYLKRYTTYYHGKLLKRALKYHFRLFAIGLF